MSSIGHGLSVHNMPYDVVASRPSRRSGFGSRLRGFKPGSSDRERFIVYGWLAVLLLVTFLVGLRGVGAIRPVFILGCIAMGWRALKAGPAVHAEICVVLFSFTPFLRRIVDLSAGFDANSLMLIGPLLALAVPVLELGKLLLRRDPVISTSVYVPYLIMAACLLYGWALSAFSGDFAQASAITIRSVVPMLYAVYLIRRYDVFDQVMDSVVRAFVFVTPIMGIYGVMQYVNPQPWDRVWMLNTAGTLNSIGKPEPMQVRVFSTMNSPATYAAFAACGLMLVGFCRRGWLLVLLAVPITIGLLLSMLRAAWLSLAFSVVVCFLFNRTRPRATLFVVCLIAAAAGVILLTPFGPEIVRRLMSMTGNVSDDGSGSERIRELMFIYSDQQHYLFGNGLAGVKGADPRLLAIDGQLVISAVTMGIVIGNLYVLVAIWACLQGILSLEQNAPMKWLVASAVVIGNLAVLPLAVFTAGEGSFPIWAFAALLTARQQWLIATKRPARFGKPVPGEPFPLGSGNPPRRRGQAPVMPGSN